MPKNNYQEEFKMQERTKGHSVLLIILIITDLLLFIVTALINASSTSTSLLS